MVFVDAAVIEQNRVKFKTFLFENRIYQLQ